MVRGGGHHGGMASEIPSSPFPDLITSLPAFEGDFPAHKLGADDCDEVLFACYPAGTDIASHTHPTENRGVVLSGCMELTVEGTTTIHHAGEWYAVPKEAVHSARCPEATSAIEFWFCGERFG